jgi:cytochrome c551/c552
VTEIPVPKIKISTSKADIAKGQEMFASKGCVACHKVGGGKLVGPDLKDVLKRRDQTWVAKFILRPDLMLAQDPEAKKLLTQYFVPMPNQNVDPKTELPLILAYLKGAK